MSIKDLTEEELGANTQYTKNFVDYWDELIGWEGRIESEGNFYTRLFAANDVELVADVASGTGFHGINLTKQGFKVIASDGAENMVKKTRENAAEHGVELHQVLLANWLELDKKIGENQVDAIICLGNSFTHLFEHEARRDALESMYRTVKPGGLVVIDHRNYDSMLDQGYTSKHKYYYTGKGVDARPIELNRYLARFEYTFPSGAVFQLKMYPLRADYVSHLLEDAGFINVDRYGDFQKPYDRQDVDFIQQIAYKPVG